MKIEFPQAELSGADIQIRMKSLIALFAGEISGYGFENVASGLSAFERSLSWARNVSDASKIVLFVSDDYQIPSQLTDVTVVSNSWDASSFLGRLALESEGFDHVFIAWSDCPFLDVSFSASLYKKHLRYAAEYTFADGYPYGFCPDILAQGILPILANIAKDNFTPVSRNLIFETIKKDINSFDIETEIAPVDLRQLRLNLCCDTKRNTLLCSALDGINAINYNQMVSERSAFLRTLPAFYAIQVAGRCPFECTYCPYPSFCKSGKASSPGKSCTQRIDEMPLDSFTQIISKIAEFSEDAVISLSLWGECSYHSNIGALVKTVLSYPGLSVLIETTGIGWKSEDIDLISSLVSTVTPRTNGQKPINWIVSLDAVGSECYGSIHGIEQNNLDPSLSASLIRDAHAFTEKISSLFPSAVWPQMVRMNENEVELETFYRFWKQKYDQVIVQKHDHFCRSIEDRRVADLSPLVRNPCWHIKRDMCILLDGTVPLCREDVYATSFLGNAITDDFSKIWENGRSVYEQHTGCNYQGMCGACDEYYTYNF